MDAPHFQKIKGVSIFYFNVCLLILSSCNAINTPDAPYLPPLSENMPASQSATIITPPLPIYTLPPPPSTQIEICTDNLLYIEDTTIPDWTNLKPGLEVDKQWQVENNGTCDWDYRYTLRLTTGDGLGIATEQDLYPARAGSKAIIHINFTTPPQAGTYHNVWQAYNPMGQPFGDPISILVVVEP
ncbi:MAG: hypothetical protein A2X25_04375 [Chloroflexi bacterium GWB2_49_20]|nr:MAG: hypothetical protein A2X25_04375 [Chloroflexi bacterium GWB2_49_20]OGN78616.1 MAG: hypothetical protein A2X26_12435 [Chloroflexi bacterium GWC2_49_37]OGN85718.1 MAG: hypothetical protein A2X27_00905 [Chloroflexi bacterium GWD2_49_16]HBG75057.1 hypothetical protein [Anaerolineae bacterium]HCC78083.1 hypothetical protein [Anaerolineae bacterium]